MTDEQALADRRATGCLYDTGLCACPDAPYEYPGCRAPRNVANPPQRPRCDARADSKGFIRCGKPAGHTGDRHTADLLDGTYTWGYVPTAEEADRG